ncbi:MAG: hypothetical protein KF782_21410 [Labilithrix sp.]|nr:hypothetical protein [Labilithrix sp.]
MSSSVIPRHARRPAGLSQASFESQRAPEQRVLASDVMDGSDEDGDPMPPSSRSPGMHLGHEVLLAVITAMALFATLLLNATHC